MAWSRAAWCCYYCNVDCPHRLAIVGSCWFPTRLPLIGAQPGCLGRCRQHLPRCSVCWLGAQASSWLEALVTYWWLLLYWQMLSSVYLSFACWSASLPPIVFICFSVCTGCWPHARVSLTLLSTAVLAAAMLAGGLPLVSGFAAVLLLIGFWLDQRVAVPFSLVSES